MGMDAGAEAEVQRIKELVAEEPRRLSYVKSKIEDETGKSSSKITLANIVKKQGWFTKDSVNHANINGTKSNSMTVKLLWMQEAESKGLINLFFF